MIDETLRRIEGDGPSARFVADLRQQLTTNHRALPTVETDGGKNAPIAVIELDRRRLSKERPRILWRLTAAAALLALVGMTLALRALVTHDHVVEIAATSETRQVGDAWLRSIISADRQQFVSLHGVDIEVDDTLMGFSEDVGILTPSRTTELYYSGFDALQAALEIDNDEIKSGGCEDIAGDQVRCSFTATMIGTDDYSYTVTADLTIKDRQITQIDFSTSTDPADFRSVIEQFMADLATDEDRACLTLGFNTVGCGEHESDFLTRYAAYYEAGEGEPDG